MLLLLTAGTPFTATGERARRRVFAPLYWPEDAPRFSRNLFKPPRSDSPNCLGPPGAFK